MCVLCGVAGFCVVCRKPAREEGDVAPQRPTAVGLRACFLADTFFKKRWIHSHTPRGRGVPSLPLMAAQEQLWARVQGQGAGDAQSRGSGAQGRSGQMGRDAGSASKVNTGP